MKVYVLVFDTYNNGTQIELFTTKDLAYKFIDEWAESKGQARLIVKGLDAYGIYEEDNKRPWSVRLDKCLINVE